MEEKNKHTSLQEIVKEKQERKEQLVFQLLLKEWSENEQSIRSLSQQIAKLEQNSGLEQVNQRMDEIKKEAAKAMGAILSIRYKKRLSNIWVIKSS